MRGGVKVYVTNIIFSDRICPSAALSSCQQTVGETDGKKNTFKNSAFQTRTDWFAIDKLQEVEKYHIKIRKENFQKDFFAISTFKKCFGCHGKMC